MVRSAADGHVAPPPAPGAERYVALDFANSVLAMPGGQVVDLLGSPSSAADWLRERQLIPARARLQEVCAQRLRRLRDDVRMLLAAQVQGGQAPAEALAAVNTALTSVPSAALLQWDEVHGLHRATAHPTDQIVDRAGCALARGLAIHFAGSCTSTLESCTAPVTGRSGRRPDSGEGGLSHGE